MTISEASNLVLQAATQGTSGEVFLLDMGEPVKIVDLARQMIRLSGCTEAEVPIKIIGPRAGEKLYEELTTEEERVQATALRKVNLVVHPEFDSVLLERIMARMGKLVLSEDLDAIRDAYDDLGIGYRCPEWPASRSAALSGTFEVEKAANSRPRAYVVKEALSLG